MATAKTTAPVQPGNTTGVMPEFGRTADVQRLFGLKRGTAYNLLADGKVRGCVLRVRGQRSGVRLWDLQSIRDYIAKQIAKQTLHFSQTFAGGAQ